MINFKTPLFKSPATQSVKGKAKAIQDTMQAINRSHEILEKAELAVTRSYAIVEISRDFLINNSPNDKPIT